MLKIATLGQVNIKQNPEKQAINPYNILIAVAVGAITGRSIGKFLGMMIGGGVAYYLVTKSEMFELEKIEKLKKIITEKIT